METKTVVMATDNAGWTHVAKKYGAPKDDHSIDVTSECGQAFSARAGIFTSESDQGKNGLLQRCAGCPSMPGYEKPPEPPEEEEPDEETKDA